MKKKLILLVVIVGIFLIGCQSDPGGAESSPAATSSSAERVEESVSSAQTEDVSSESSDEESYTVVETYGERFSLISRTVIVSNQGVISQYEELALMKDGEILYGFDRGITEVRFKYGFLRIMSDNGEGLLAEDGEEVISLGTVKHVYVDSSWVTAEEWSGKGMLYRATDDGIQTIYESDRTFFREYSYGGITQFGGGGETLLIDQEYHVIEVERSFCDWELQENKYKQFVTNFYNTLRECTWEDYEALLPYLPENAKEGLESASDYTGGITEDSIGKIKGYALLKALLMSDTPLSERCGLEDVELVCAYPGGSTDGFLEFELGEEWLDLIIFITARSDGTFFISYFEGVLK